MTGVDRVTSALRCTGLAAFLLFGLSAAADAQNACGIPPSGLVRLWDGIGCQGQSIDFTASSLVTAFPAYSISNGTGRWIAVTDTPDPRQASHTLLIQNGCYYPDLSAFHWGNGRSWVGHIRAIQILPAGTNPETYPTDGNRVIGRCR
jgi:hypothetical protein